MDIVPAVIPQTFADILTARTRTAHLTRALQVDVVDGDFVPFTSWPYREESDLFEISDLTAAADIEVDLMVADVDVVAFQWISAGVSRIVVHLESALMLPDIYAAAHAKGVLCGVSVGNDVPLTELFAALPYADFVQCMGIAHIGSQGQPFDERVLARIDAIHAHAPQLPISVDGSVNVSTIGRLAAHRVSRVVVGSALMGAADVDAAYQALARATAND